MSYKLGLLLSTLFLISAILLGADLCMVNATYQSLDAVSLTVGHRISYDGEVSSKTLSYVKSQGMELIPVTSGSPIIGEIYVYKLETEYNPMILKKSAMTISVTRSCLVGFYRV